MAASRFYSNKAVAGTLGNTPTLSNSGTTMFLSATPSGYPGSFPFRLVIDPGTANMEIVQVASGSGTSGTPWVISRGVDSTTAVAHNNGVPVVHDFTAADAQDSRNHEALGSGSGVHGLPATAWQTGSFAVISETILANSTTSAVTFSSIPQTYAHLLIIAKARLTETSDQSNDIALTINGDSAARYSHLNISGTNTSGSLTAPADSTSFAASSVPLFRVAASQAGSAVNIGAGLAWLPWYTSTAFNHMALSMSGAGNGTSSMVDGRLRWCFYNPVTQAAITSLSLATPSGFFLTGSSFGLYGLS